MLILFDEYAESNIRVIKLPHSHGNKIFCIINVARKKQEGCCVPNFPYTKRNLCVLLLPTTSLEFCCYFIIITYVVVISSFLLCNFFINSGVSYRKSRKIKDWNIWIPYKSWEPLSYMILKMHNSILYIFLEIGKKRYYLLYFSLQ